MIKFYEGELADLWPDQKSPEFLALSYALKNAIILLKEKADKTKCYSDIDKLDEGVLDYLAVELRTMYYNQDLPIEQKREIIKKTMLWYTKAGTVPAVAEMIEVIFGTGKIVEWPDYTEPPYTRGTFDIITSVVMTEDVMERLINIIRRVKNVRSHIRRVVIERELHSAMHAAIPIITGASASYVTNELQGSAETRIRENIAAMGAAESSRSTVTNDTTGSATAKGKILEAQRGVAIIANTFIKEEH